MQADYVHSHGVGAIVQRNVNVTKNAAGTFVTFIRGSAVSLYQNLGWTKYNDFSLTWGTCRQIPLGIVYPLQHDVEHHNDRSWRRRRNKSAGSQRGSRTRDQDRRHNS